MDVTFINPGNDFAVYQSLSTNYSAIEPPTWALLLAESCRSKGHSVSIIDANAESLADNKVVERLKELNTKLICLVVYGQNVNAGTVGMAAASRLSKHIKEAQLNIPIGLIGSYVQALPHKTIIDEAAIDFGLMNEGVYALHNILNGAHYSSVNGVVWRGGDGKPIMNPPEKVVPQERLHIDLPGYAWDLLPFNVKPLDLYRAPMWHAGYNESKRSPYVAIQTSLGCPMRCEFCMINTINRNDTAEIGVAGNYSKIRYWEPEFIIKEFDKLANLGVSTIKITDELHLFNKKYYAPLHKMLSERGGDKLYNLWAYSRVDTVSNPELLEQVREAGIKWLALGIESSDRNVRLEISKGKFEEVDIKRVVNQIHNAGIEVMANYIFGLPKDTAESMQRTLDLSLELCTSGWNGYAAMALPGSKLYFDALTKKIPLPTSYLGYSFHAYETLPIGTEFLTPADVLKFRDDAYGKYHTDNNVLNRIERVFGNEARASTEKMSQTKLKRKILGD